MPSLILMKSPGGGTPGETIPLDAGEAFVIGRDAETCQIVIPHHAISRRHAQIVRVQDKYFIEDLNSRNKTFVNHKEIKGRTSLPPDTLIKICDFLFRFQDDPAPKPDLPDHMRKEATAENLPPSEMTTFEATVSQKNARGLLDTQPAERLRALLEVSTSLARTLELDPLLNEIAQTLFGVFKQADRVFVLLLDDAGRPIPKVVKSRRPGLDDTRFSRTIVRKALDKMESYLSEDASADMSLGPAHSIAEFKIRSVMCVPLASSDNRPLGALQLDTQERSKKFKEDDLKLLTIVANLASVAIEKARLHASVLDQQREHQEIELAKQVQLGFLPQHMPAVDGYEFYAHYSPAKMVGGDYYDFIRLAGGRTAVVVGDVAGKGVPAALLTAKLSSEVRFVMLTRPTLAEAVCGLNESLLRGGLGDRFVTMALAVIDPAAHTVTLVNAGHPNPKLYHGGRNVLLEAISTERTGLPLGVMENYPYESVTVALDPLDSLVLFTDGVTDAMSPAGDFFGNDGVDRIFQTDDPLADENACRPTRLGLRLVTAVKRFAAGRAQNDDIAVVSFGRVNGPRPADTGPVRTA